MDRCTHDLRQNGPILTNPYFDTYVCLDIETTSRPANRIIEVGAVLVVRGRPQKIYTRLVDPGLRIPPPIVRLTGITDQMVSGRRNIFQILPELKKFIGDRILVGHDLIQNDMKNLRSVGERCGVEFDNPVFDTLMFSRSFINGTCGLSHLTELLGVPWEVRHRAASDAEATREVFEKLKVLHCLMKEEKYSLNEGEIHKVAQNVQRYLGILDKFQYAT
ncbi:hypothetical protein ABB02_00134 [Clostridiaceae bacterium JG1575]|nr:hypothetical protein ABB02_00134 [Clostridiaceae bacterium JG1575]